MIEYSREFVCLSSELNYARAAKLLHVSQPSLSRHISDLEKELGFKLFERNPLSLTAAGKYYLESISDVIKKIDTIVETGRLIDRENSLAVRVCMVPFDLGVYANVVYEGAAQFRFEHPESVVQFVAPKAHTVYEALTSGKADIAVMFCPPDEVQEDIAVVQMIEYPCMIWAHRNNPALAHEPVALEDFAQSKLIESSNKLFNEWLAADVATLKKVGLTLGTRMKDIESASDYFVTLQPDEIQITSSVNITCPYNPNIVGVHFDDSRFRFPTYLVYRQEPERPTVEAFVQACLAVGERYMVQTESYSFAGKPSERS